MTSDRIEMENKFKERYNELDPSVQVQLDHFIAGVEEVGQDMVGETIFNGSIELLRMFMPCLEAISPTVSVLPEIGITNYYRLKWEPNDFLIPADVLVRAYERVKTPSTSSHYVGDDCPSSFNYDGDDCPSSYM